MTPKTYEEGVRDGEINTLKITQARHEVRLDSHSKRLRSMERISWLVIGGLVVLQALPVIQQLFDVFE
ncbi:MAG: hypothetical protein GY761_13160 [Hyphomicrobiales bacterium]|nr:hypothetical protein [Hyphomicrobiales bacterium]